MSERMSDGFLKIMPVGKSREEARDKGYRKFFGSVCKRGHSGIRYTVGGNCVQCLREHRYRPGGSMEELHPSRMLDIDHRVETKSIEDTWAKQYYDTLMGEL